MGRQREKFLASLRRDVELDGVGMVEATWDTHLWHAVIANVKIDSSLR